MAPNFCTECGKPVMEQSAFCRFCGSALGATPQAFPRINELQQARLESEWRAAQIENRPKSRNGGLIFLLLIAAAVIAYLVVQLRAHEFVIGFRY